MFKRIFSLVLASAMVMTLFTGCGSNEASSDTSTQSTPSVEEKKEEAPKVVEIVKWATSQMENDYTKEQDAKFMADNPNIKINTVIHEGDPGNDFMQAIAAGNAPDYVECSNAKLDGYARAGIIQPLDDFFGKWDDSSKFDKKYIDQVTINGKLMSIPSQGGNYFLAYNKKLFKDAGLTQPPKTWEEMLDYAKKLTKPENQQSGYNMLAAEWTEWFFEYYVWQAGGDLTKKNADGTLELTFTDPAVITAAKYYQDLRKAKVTQGDITMKFDALVKSFASGKVGMMIFAGDWVSRAVELGMKAEDIGLAIPPAGPSGKPYIFGGVGGGFVINAKSAPEKQQAAWEYIKFLSSVDYIGGNLKYQSVKGPIGPIFPSRTDFDILKYVPNLDPEWVKAQQELKPFMRDEFYGKGVVGKYIDKAVQKCIVDPNADPEKEFKAAQELATKEVLNDFNTKVKEENK